MMISQRGETNEATPRIGRAFYLEMFSKTVAQLGKLSKKS